MVLISNRSAGTKPLCGTQVGGGYLDSQLLIEWSVLTFGRAPQQIKGAHQQGLQLSLWSPYHQSTFFSITLTLGSGGW